MLICNRCGSVFETPGTEIDYVDGVDGYRYSVCPKCADDDIDEAVRCLGCGEYVKRGRDYCNDCRDQVYKDLHEIWASFGRKREVLDLMGDWLDAQ